MQFRKLITAILLLLPLMLLAQSEDNVEIDHEQLKEELATVRTELAEAARRMAEIQRQLVTQQTELEDVNRLVFRFNENELVELENLHELGSQIRSNFEMDFDDFELLRLGELEGLPPRLGVILSDDEDQLTVLGVTPGSGAEQAGIENGDVLIAVNSRAVESGDPSSVGEILSEFKVGDTVPVTVIRDGQNLNIDVITGSSMSNIQMLVDNIETMVPGMGLQREVIVLDDGQGLDFPNAPPMPSRPVFPTTPMLGRNTDLISNHAGLESYFGTSEGVVILRIDRDNALNLQSGDVLLRVEQENVQRPVDLGRLLLLSGEAGDPVTIEVMRNGVLTQVQGNIPEPMVIPGMGLNKRIRIERAPKVDRLPRPPVPPGNNY